MLMWDKPEVIEGLMVYGDHEDWTMFYVMPDRPRFSLDDNGKPVFKFIKYKFPIDRKDGRKGGGFLIADVEFTVEETKLDLIKQKLQERLNQVWLDRGLQAPAPPVKIGQKSFLRGTANITVLDNNGNLVEKINSPAAPSLYGRMITPFTVELTPEGATFMEQALQGNGGIVQVAYDVWLPVRIPPVEAHVWFNAQKYAAFHQDVDIEDRFWSEDSYRENIRETFSSSGVSGVIIEPGLGVVTDPKVINSVRDWAWKSLEDEITRMVLGDIPPVDRNVKDWYEEHNIENITRDVIVNKVTSFNRTYKEGMVMDWNPSPRGALPNITSMIGPDGQPYKWKDYSLTVDLDDPFFKQLRVTTRANANFEKLPLDSVEVKIEYKEGTEYRVKEFNLMKSDDVGKFETYIANNSYKYKYSYQVNYKNESERFQSPVIESDEENLTINVGDTGILLVDIELGDLNFTQVKEALVTLQYEDNGNGIDLIEQTFKLDKEHVQHNWIEVIFKPRRNPYRYRVKYFMEDGKEYQSDWQNSESSKLFINDPFSASKTVNIRGVGDFNNRIVNIFYDVHYRDEENTYNQSYSGALNNENTFLDWSFPVISETSGKITYTGIIQYMDGTIHVIPETIAERNTILFVDIDLNQEIEVMPDLIDFDFVKLVKVTLNYRDETNNINETDDLVFKKGDGTKIWRYLYKDKTKQDYEWSASYFMADGSVKKILKNVAEDKTLVLPEKAV